MLDAEQIENWQKDNADTLQAAAGREGNDRMLKTKREGIEL